MHVVFCVGNHLSVPASLERLSGIYCLRSKMAELLQPDVLVFTKLETISMKTMLLPMRLFLITYFFSV